MTNLMKVPHTVVFEAIIDLDKIPASMLPTLIALDKNAIEEMCKGATLNALSLSNTLEVANTGNYWAELTVKDSE